MRHRAIENLVTLGSITLLTACSGGVGRSETGRRSARLLTANRDGRGDVQPDRSGRYRRRRLRTGGAGRDLVLRDGCVARKVRRRGLARIIVGGHHVGMTKAARVVVVEDYAEQRAGERRSAGASAATACVVDLGRHDRNLGKVGGAHVDAGLLDTKTSFLR